MLRSGFKPWLTRCRTDASSRDPTWAFDRGKINQNQRLRHNHRWEDLAQVSEVPLGYTSFLRIGLISQDRYDSQRTAAAAPNLHRQSDDVESLCRQSVQITQILERWDVFRKQDAVSLEHS